MVAEASTRRMDEQLESILYETANWIVNDVQGMVLCDIASLRLGMDKAGQFAVRGREVVALIHGRPAEIVGLSGEVGKLTHLEVESPISPWPRVATCIGETADNSDGPLPALIPNGAVYREATV
jgi:hypothetical protein